MKKSFTLFFRITLLITLLFSVAQRASSQLVINEFLASNDFSLPGPEGDYPDWIEIYNAGAEDVMLGGYFLADDLVDPEAMYMIPDTYPDSVTVPAGGYILFYANKGEATSVLNLDFKLSGDGEQIGFWDPAENLLDGFDYGPQITDITYGRTPDGADDWTFFGPGTPGESNDGGTVYSLLMINEFMASNDFAFPGPQGDYPDWIEIYNAGPEDVMLGGYFMADDLSDPSKMYQILDTYPDSVTVPAGGHIVFYANKDTLVSVLNLNFKLSGGGEEIGFWNPAEDFIDSLTYGEQIADTSYGRVFDGSIDWVLFSTSTPWLPNEEGVIVVSVISYSKDDFIPLSVYPNPTIGSEVTFNKIVNIQVYNLAGQRLFVDNNVSRLDVTRFDSGLYLIQTDEGELVKLIIK